MYKRKHYIAIKRWRITIRKAVPAYVLKCANTLGLWQPLYIPYAIDYKGASQRAPSYGQCPYFSNAPFCIRL